MKIVHVELTMRLADGGVVRAVLDLAGAVAAQGHDVTLMACTTDDVPDPWKAGEPGVPGLVTLPTPSRPMRRFSRAQLTRATEVIADADVLHLHGAWTPSNLQFAAIARAHNVAYVISPHGMLDDWTIAQGLWKKKLFLALGGRRWLERAGAVHCTAAAELEQSSKWFPRGRGVVVPLFLDIDQYTDLPGPELAHAAWPELAADEPTVLFLSRLHVKKGIELLLDAIELLAQRSTPARLLIAGAGDPAYEREIRERASRLGDRVRFLGFVSGPEKISLLQAADLFALPSHQENFGYALFEALAAETVVVTSRDVDTWPEVVESGGGVAIERDAALLADTICSLLGDPDRCAAMGRAGRAWVLKNLHPDTVVSRYQELYHSVVQTHH
jgi:glycosyltransferase involved in cell wall biosynthesis